MNVVLLLCRTRLRLSWRAALVISVLFGLGGGVTLAVTAGARRTASANDAIVRAANAPDYGTSFQSQDPDEVLARLERLPGVRGVSIMVGFSGRLEGDGLPAASLNYFGLRTDRPTFDRPIVLAGRLPTGPDEVLLNEGAAARTGLGLGDRTTLALAKRTTISDSPDNVVRAQVEVVGIGLLSDEVIEDELGGRPIVLLSRALTQAHIDRLVYGVVGLSVVSGDVAAVAAGLPGAGGQGGSGKMLIEGNFSEDRARAQMGAVIGDPWPPIAEGRVPRTSREILVGRATLEDLGLRVGEEVQLTVERMAELGPGPAAPPMTVHVVGSAVAPAAGQAGSESPRLGRGFLLSAETLAALQGQGGVAPYVLLFDLEPGADPQALIDRFPEGLPDSNGLPTEWYTSAVPAEVRQAEDARPAIWLGVGALAVAVVATIGHSLLGFVRQRRRDYAVLKALGFTPAQVRATVLWQSGAVLAVALVAAIPVGVAAGRWLWTAFAEDLGVLVRPVVPLALLGAAIVITVVVVQAAALVPAALARRTPAGQALHAE